MKKIFIFLFLFVPLILFSQVKGPYKTTAGEKEYWVYPFRIEPGQETQIPPVTFLLPDGNYILYYDFQYKRTFNPITWKYKERPVDSTNVAALFTIKNGKKEGECKWYLNSKKKIIYAKGNYYNDEKNGLWSFYGYYSGKIYLREKYVYKNDEYDGPYTSYFYGSARIATEGFYKNNKQYGTWKTHLSNGEISSQYTIADSFRYKNSLYEKMIQTLVEDASMQTYGFRFYESNKSTPYNGECFEQSIVGDHKTKMVFDNGILTYMDTIRTWSGKTEFLIKKLQPDLHDTVSEFFIYNRMNYPYFNAYMVNGKLTGKIDFTRDGKGHEDTSAIHYYYSDEIKEKDTLVVNSVSIWKYDTKKKVIRQQQTMYIHYPTKITLYDNDDSGIPLVQRLSYNKTKDKLYIKNSSYSYANRLKTEFTTVYFRDSLSEKNYRFRGNGRSYYNINENTIQYLDEVPLTGKIRYPEGKVKKKKRETIEKQGEFYVFYPGNAIINFRAYNSNQVEGEMLNGKKHGEWTESHKGIIYSHENYKNGEFHGTQISYNDKYISKDEREEAEECGITDKKFVYLSSIENYKNGVLDGNQFQFNYKGDLFTFEQYKNGKRDGVYESYHYKGYPLIYAEYKDGWYNGKYVNVVWEDEAVYDSKYRFVRYDQFKSSMRVAHFKDGWLNGEFELYENGIYKKQDPQLTRKGSAKNGVKTGDWLFYYDEEFSKQVKEKTTHVLSDSCYFYFKETGARIKSDNTEEFSGRKNTEETLINYDYYREEYEPVGYNDFVGKTGYYINYLKNGNKNMEGRIEDNVRVGTWKFYDEGGTLVKEVNYDPAKFLFTDSKGEKDSVMHYGTYKSWYYNGNLQSEGFILSEGTKYDCYAELSIPDHELMITNCRDMKGIQLVKNGEGSIQFTDPNGVIVSEGKLSDYRRNGVWKFYAPDKTLTEIGNYEAGKKHGKWLTGDLEGLNFQDEACFDMDSPFMAEQMEIEKKQISIQEKVYDQDKLIRYNEYNMNLNKEYKYNGRFRLFQPRARTYTGF